MLGTALLSNGGRRSFHDLFGRRDLENQVVVVVVVVVVVAVVAVVAVVERNSVQLGNQIRLVSFRLSLTRKNSVKLGKTR